jgi:diadenosine tetraphosphate (Ap4A) HIT family hydrolase
MLETDLFYARWDNFPVSPGHAEIVPKRHIESIFDLNEEEREEMFELLRSMKEVIQIRHRPDGFNVGVNEGRAAGRTIDHLHVHLIPRYVGDVEDPVGGVRNIIPGKGDYLKG